eukprot:357381-Chlamydomonas_euryale.AAC.22
MFSPLPPKETFAERCLTQHACAVFVCCGLTCHLCLYLSHTRHVLPSFPLPPPWWLPSALTSSRSPCRHARRAQPCRYPSSRRTAAHTPPLRRRISLDGPKAAAATAFGPRLRGAAAEAAHADADADLDSVCDGGESGLPRRQAQARAPRPLLPQQLPRAGPRHR